MVYPSASHWRPGTKPGLELHWRPVIGTRDGGQLAPVDIFIAVIQTPRREALVSAARFLNTSELRLVLVASEPNM